MTNDQGEIVPCHNSVVFQIESLYQNSIFSLLFMKKPDNGSTNKTSKLKELEKTRKRLKKDFDEANIVLSGYCENVDKLRKEYESLQKKAKELEGQNQIMSSKKTDLENELTLLAKAKPNSRDEDLVGRTKLQYKCLRNIMQVRFSYEKSDDVILTGYVFNKITKKVCNFSLNLSKLDSNQVEERLMKLMKATSHSDYGFVSIE